MAPPPPESERTPLLSGPQISAVITQNGIGNEGATGKPKETLSTRFTRLLGPPNTFKILLAGYILSLSFSLTQVPIFYAFHLIECDVYYETRPPYTGSGDRCSVDAIAAATSMQMSIVGMSTTFFGTWNLFVAGWTVKQWGARLALVVQTLFPALRVSIQTVGVFIGGRIGVVTIICSQVVTILGGPAGYILVVNTIAGEVVEPLQRTAIFGRLQGCIMLGTATGFLLGGVIGDAFGIRMPFQVAFVLFGISATYAGVVLPYISPESMNGGKKGGTMRKGFLAPLRSLAPQVIRLPGGGGLKKHYGVLFLCCGIFTSVLATGYAPMLVQMYATARFDFSQADNGLLMSGNFLVRGVFLIFIFPRIIAAGRKWWASGKRANRDQRKTATDPTRPETLPTAPEDFDAPAGLQGDEEPNVLEPPEEEDRSACHFDLIFLRWSLVVDGVLTTLAAFATQGWHMYLAAYLLPFGSGSAPAAKGVITEMIPSSQRTDALNAITLVENIARLSTVGFFGMVFAALAGAGVAHLTFFCNAAIAIVGMLVLCFSHFPPRGSEVVEDLATDEGTEDGAPGT